MRLALSVGLVVALLGHQGLAECTVWTSTYPLAGDRMQPLFAAYDPIRDRVYVQTRYHGMWSWDGDPSSWIMESYENLTQFNHPDGMYYDSVRDHLVLRGTTDWGPQTWEWNGSAWSQGPGGPDTEYGAFVYDSARNVGVLIGAVNSSEPNCALVMAEYNGSTWTDITVNGISPPARWYSSVAYDSRRGKIVLYGGYLLPFRSNTPLGDTWEYDPITRSWTPIDVAGPPARWCGSMQYDPARGVCVLFGGVDYENSGTFGDTWEWNGSSWSNVTPPIGRRPEAKYYALMAFEADRGVMYICGGQTVSIGQNWRLSDAAYEFGPDCNCDGIGDTDDGGCPRTVTQWRSLRTHSGYGELGIVLNAAATGNGQYGPKVEARGVNTNAGPRKIAVDFSGPVALLDPTKISVTYDVTVDPQHIVGPYTLTPSNVQMSGPQTLTFELPGAPNNACYTFALLPGLTSATINGDNDCMVRALAGDSNMDGQINVVDMAKIKAYLGYSPVVLPELDNTLGGGINVLDMAYCKSGLAEGMNKWSTCFAPGVTRTSPESGSQQCLPGSPESNETDTLAAGVVGSLNVTPNPETKTVNIAPAGCFSVDVRISTDGPGILGGQTELLASAANVFTIVGPAPLGQGATDHPAYNDNSPADPESYDTDDPTGTFCSNTDDLALIPPGGLVPTGGWESPYGAHRTSGELFFGSSRILTLQIQVADNPSLIGQTFTLGTQNFMSYDANFMSNDTLNGEPITVNIVAP